MQDFCFVSSSAGAAASISDSSSPELRPRAASWLRDVFLTALSHVVDT